MNVTIPRFSQGENVLFIGGSGKVKSYQPESGSWSYLVEMAMGPEPEMGRIGWETTIRLFEADLTALEAS